MAELMKQTQRPDLGFGLGLRPEHYETIVQQWPQVDWFEVVTENYMVDGGKPLHYLDRIRERYPVVAHGVSLGIGSCERLDLDYLEALKTLVKRIGPRWISDHLCWTGVGGKNMHDLLPLPYTEEAVAHVASKVTQVQDFLGQQILLENVSSYVTYGESAMCEWEFLAAVAQRADCLILLDVNNIYVSSRNHGFNPRDYLRGIPAERVYQFHLAGHTDNGNIIVDTHDQPVVEPVWALYAEAVGRFGRVSTMIERDDAMPPLNTLLAELARARAIAAHVLQGQAA